MIRLIRVKPPGARRFAARSSAPCKDLAYYWRHPLGHTCVFPRPAFDISQVRRYDPPLEPAAQWSAAFTFVLALLAAVAFLWNAHAMPLEEQLAAMGMIVAGSWLVGAISTPHHAPRASTETSAAAIARRPGSQS